jgi:hypothetical protein
VDSGSYYCSWIRADYIKRGGVLFFYFFHSLFATSFCFLVFLLVFVVWIRLVVLLLVVNMYVLIGPFLASYAFFFKDCSGWALILHFQLCLSYLLLFRVDGESNNLVPFPLFYFKNGCFLVGC